MMNTKYKNGRGARKAACYAALTIVFMFPLYWFFLNSLKSYEDIFQFPPKFWVWPLRFANYPEAYN